MVKIGSMYRTNGEYLKDLAETLNHVVDFQRFYGSRFLITGASGLIGAFLTDLLFYANEIKQADIKVYVLVRNREYASHRFRSLLDHPGFQMIVQDVCEPVSLEDGVDYIVHAAGDGYPGAFRERPVETMMPALVGTWQLLEYARKCSAKRLLYVSSGEVYGEKYEQFSASHGLETGNNFGSGISSSIGFTEDYSGYVNPMKIRSCYPSAKRAAETLCVSYYAQYGVETVVARPSHVYGPGFSPKDNRASAQFFRDVLAGRDVCLTSEGKQIRSYTYVGDCVSALLTILATGKAGEAYNVALNDVRVTIKEFAQITAEVGQKKCVFHIPGKENLENAPISQAVLNSEKLQKLGWSGAYDIRKGIQHTFKIMKSHDGKI